MVCLELMTGEQPFNKISRDIIVLRELDNGKLPDRPGRQVTALGLSDELWSLMKKCWNKKPDARPTMTMLREKLAEMRGVPMCMFATELQVVDVLTINRTAAQPMKRRSLFSLNKRPTTGTNSSVSSSSSNLRLKPFPTLTDGHIAEEHNPLTPISSSNSGSIRHHYSSTHSAKISTSRDSDFRYERATRSAQDGPRLDNSRLEVPRTSSSVPSSFGGNFSSGRAPSESHPAQSIISSESGRETSPSLREALNNPKSIIHFSRSGSVASGTLEGLVERLISNFNLRRDLEYREILFTGCTDFTTPEDLFAILARRFHEVESVTVAHPEDRIAVQYK
ncbi:hypothetical protein H0H81_002954 [Sphagnurus paluster]|uniref:Uncharacterized protein n=1 Tax=Sphagnurus paluster TaxID=117069 RepID=A0A9P7KHQ1_9AGAR|nr:hypothetical protein H0H81_002954 [Sphagnurus paluster]